MQGPGFAWATLQRGRGSHGYRQGENAGAGRWALAKGRKAKEREEEDSAGVLIDREEVTNGVHTTMIGYNQAGGQ